MFICRNGDTLPHSWEVAVLPDVAEVNPRTDFSGYEDGRIISFIPMPLVEEKTGKLDSSRTEELRKVKKGYTRFIEGDVLFAKITPCMENGKVALAEKLQGGIGAGSTEYHVLRAYSGVLNRYLLYYLLQAAFRQDAQHHMTGTAGQKRVPSKYIENSQIPLPPTDEQHRIVSKIEELFSDLDQGEAALRKVQTLLTRYRQAVLKAA
ncbi:MAG: restriction endonuclease subunit S, partial [Chloroflexaceae bacterium]